MKDTELASVTGGGQYRQVIVKRQINAPIERVWRALTSSEEIHHWWAAGVIEAREGGKIRLGDQSEPCGADAGLPLDGTVKVCIAPNIFEFVWHDNYPDAGLVRFDLLEIDETTTQITLVQNVPVKDIVLATAGWYELAERLSVYSTTNEAVPIYNDPNRFDKLKGLFKNDGAG